MQLNQSFISFLNDLSSLKRDKRHYEYYFRGHSDEKYTLLPSIYRTEKISSSSNKQLFIESEHLIFREIISKAPNDFINEFTTIEKLVKMQHYGLPTRLLDITSNPLVALYFACENTHISNGEVVVFKIPKTEVKFYDSDTVCILANIAKMNDEFAIDNRFLKKNSKTNTDDFNQNEGDVSYLLHEIKNEKPQFSNIVNPFDFNRVLPVKVKMSNSRIIRQNGAFLLFGMNTNKLVPANLNSKWIQATITIPSNKKGSIKRDLISLGIDESTLFPEIEKQAKIIKEIYKKK